MSGIEVAGLVLGAFPLAVEGIKAYSAGMKTFKDMKNYQQILDQFSRELRVEECKYENTLLGLVTELVGPANAAGMLKVNPNEWQDNDFRSQLKGKLGPAEKTLDSWLSVAAELHERLDKVSEKFQLPAQSSWRTIFRSKFDPRVAWKVGISLGTYRTEQITQIRQWNEDLVTLANGGRKSISESSNNSIKVSPSLIKYHQQVQSHAKVLYSTLSEKPESTTCKLEHGMPYLELKFRCTPPTGPNQFLTFSLMDQEPTCQEFQLEPVNDPTNETALSPSSSSSSLPLPKSPSERGRSGPLPRNQNLSPESASKSKFLFFSRTPSPKPGSQADHKSLPYGNRPTTPTPIKQPQTRPVRTKKARFEGCDTKSKDNDISSSISLQVSSGLPTISCICMILATSTISPHPKLPLKCVGLIGTERNEHRVWTPLQQLPRPVSLVSLTDLITTDTSCLPEPSQKSRLVLGLKLISSVLQLNTTHWLSEIWEAKDIIFPKVDPQKANNILCRPFVLPKFNPNSQQQPANQERQVIGCNQSLYSLGIVLLEIWYWRTFSVLHSSLANGLSECMFAWKLSDRLYDDAGEQYGNAVRRCIRGFEIRDSETNLEIALFRNKVYEGILGPLEDNLKKFSGSENIQEIVGEI